MSYLHDHNIQADINPFESSCLSKSRQTALNRAVHEDFTHILFIDDDMKFDPQAFDLMRKREKPFIAPNILLRSTETPHTNTQALDKGFVHSVGKTGIEEMYSTGLAFALIQADALRNIAPPHFPVLWIEEEQDYLREDMAFCHILRKNNIGMYVDHDASRHVWHIDKKMLQEDFNGQPSESSSILTGGFN